MNKSLFLVLTIPLVLSGCYVPTVIRTKSRLNTGKISIFIAEKSCENKGKGYSDKESFEKAFWSIRQEKFARTRLNRNTLIKMTKQELEKCGINLRNIIIESN